MASSPASSQATNEDPTGPLSSASQATLTITPQNAEARLAFSEVADWVIERSQGSQDDEKDQARTQASNFMWTSPRHIRDAEVGTLIAQIRTGYLSSSSPSSSFSLYDNPKTVSSPADTAEAQSAVGKYIRTGCYFVDLTHPPTNVFRGWIAGRRTSSGSPDEFVLCLENTALLGIRQHHALFQVHQTGRIALRKLSDRGIVEVDGDALQPREVRVLNKHSSFVRLGQLKYEIAYSRFSMAEEHTAILGRYIQTLYRQPSPPDLSFTPTPAAGNTIQVGQWTLTTAGTVGTGGEGRVSVGVNNAGEVVALKRISVSKNGFAPKRRQNTLERLTHLADMANNDRIVRLREVITDDPKANNASADMWFVLTPFAPKTLAQCISPAKSVQVLTMIVSLLEALDFLHSNGWIHGDIKPTNIGVHHWDPEKASVVLLDIEDAIHAPQGYALPLPGCTGTVGWLSPERELQQFNFSTDVWAVGVTALWMLYGRHPWQLSINPWRQGQEFENKRQLFHRQYEDVTGWIANSNPKALGKAILQMIRHPFARTEEQRSQRPGCREILNILRALDGKREVTDGPPSKRSRMDMQ
ncbi:kinase-like domain-containing protein [Ilyonectria robusta]|uniref:kinase-like domain-containing protein n=1 Tax=Ilyonectria robusta TaxID=1079257 RepID=UPI001E8ED11F|nr:kinase-like domain-containing protein [Ilyonectria robusta]KAH8662667.1 kinase-like domain-containing protein [Ilyonectria robusta]